MKKNFKAGVLYTIGEGVQETSPRKGGATSALPARFVLAALLFALPPVANAHASPFDGLSTPSLMSPWFFALCAAFAVLVLFLIGLIASPGSRKAQTHEAEFWEPSVEYAHNRPVEKTAAERVVEEKGRVAQFRGQALGEVYNDSGNGLIAPDMVVIPSGRFIMGSPPDEEGRNAFSEGEQREVVISKPFAVSRYLITFEEYDAFCWDRRWATCGDEGWGRGAMPIINVSWIDALEYVKWLSAKTGKMYRLLSETEWEYCCRAGSQTVFAFGDTINTDQANYNGGYVYGDGRKGEYRGQTTPVYAFPPNAFGLHDMHGNVWEWVEDVWSEGYAGAPNDETPALRGDTERRVLRGGSWYSLPVFLRSANRVRYVRDFRDDDIGFRVACTL